MNSSQELELLNTFKSIDGTLKRIEQSLSAEKQQEAIMDAVSKAMIGEKRNSAPKENGNYIKEAVQKATHDTFQ